MKRAGILLLVLAGAAAADDLYALAGGRPFAKDVMILDEGGGRVTYVDRDLKQRSFQKRAIGKIVRKRTDVHEAYERFGKAKDAQALLDLAAWCRKRNFGKKAFVAIYRRALTFDPENETANRALGRVQYKGEWMTTFERKEREAEDAEKEKLAQGLVKWKDQWVTPEDKQKLEQGMRKYEGRWLTEDEIKAEKGLVKHKGQWVRKEDVATLELIGPARRDTGLGAALKFMQTRTFVVLGDLPTAQLDVLGKTMERLHQEWKRVFPATDESRLYAEGKYRLFAFKKSRPYRKLVRALYARLKEERGHSDAFLKREEARMKARLRETSFWDVQPPSSAHVQMPDPFEGLRAHCVHFAANVLATRYARLRFPTWWLNEGLGYYFEKKVTGSIQTFSTDVGGGKYADLGPGDAKANPWLDASKWNNLLLSLVRGGRDSKLDRIKGKNLYEAKNRLTVHDLAKAHSVVTFLILDDPQRFAAFFTDAKQGGGASAVERETSAVIKHYGSYRKIEERWKQYALNGFRLVR